MFSKVEMTIEAVPNQTGIEGHGEGCYFPPNQKHSQAYYYTVGKNVPKTKAALLKWEGNWSGRQNGDKAWIVVAWNGKDFSVLEHIHHYGTREVFSKYKGMTSEQAIKFAEEAEARRVADHHAFMAKFPKCKCGKVALLLQDDQPKDMCMECFRKGKTNGL